MSNFCQYTDLSISDVFKKAQDAEKSFAIVSNEGCFISQGPFIMSCRPEDIYKQENIYVYNGVNERLNVNLNQSVKGDLTVIGNVELKVDGDVGHNLTINNFVALTNYSSLITYDQFISNVVSYPFFEKDSFEKHASQEAYKEYISEKVEKLQTPSVTLNDVKGSLYLGFASDVSVNIDDVYGSITFDDKSALCNSKINTVNYGRNYTSMNEMTPSQLASNKPTVGDKNYAIGFYQGCTISNCKIGRVNGNFNIYDPYGFTSQIRSLTVERHIGSVQLHSNTPKNGNRFHNSVIEGVEFGVNSNGLIK